MKSGTSRSSDFVGVDNLNVDDVSRIRVLVYRGGTISAGDAETLFQINDRVRKAPKAWRDLFLEALTDYVVRQAHPEGYVTSDMGDWLSERVTQDGRIRSGTELELLIRILERATEVPLGLKALAFACVETHAMAAERRAGEGPTLTAEEIRLIARLISAFAGDGSAAGVSRQEAELLFRLNAASRGRPNHPSWQALFSNAFAASLLTASGYRPPDRAEALRQLGPSKIREFHVGSNLSGAIKVVRRLHAIAKEDAEDELQRTVDGRMTEQAEQLDEEESAWLIDQIGRDGVLDDNEIAALQLLSDQAPTMPPMLHPLLMKAGIPFGASSKLPQGASS